MKKSICLMIFALFFLPGLALAQGGVEEKKGGQTILNNFTDGLEYDSQDKIISTQKALEGYENEVLDAVIKKANGQPGLSLFVNYPKTLGNQNADSLLGQITKRFLDDNLANIREGLTSVEEAENAVILYRYQIFKPGKDYLSIVYEYNYTDDNRPRTTLSYSAYTFDMAKGRLLEVGDIFPDEKSMEPFAKYVNQQLDAEYNDGETAPEFAHAYSPAQIKESLGENFVFTPQGMTLVFSEGDVGSTMLVTGPKAIDIDKAKLIEFGIPSKFWE